MEIRPPPARAPQAHPREARLRRSHQGRLRARDQLDHGRAERVLQHHRRGDSPHRVPVQVRLQGRRAQAKLIDVPPIFRTRLRTPFGAHAHARSHAPRPVRTPSLAPPPLRRSVVVDTPPPLAHHNVRHALSFRHTDASHRHRRQSYCPFKGTTPPNGRVTRRPFVLRALWRRAARSTAPCRRGGARSREVQMLPSPLSLLASRIPG